MRKTLVFLAVLGLATTGFAAISYDDGTKTLTYGAPGDLDSVVDPQPGPAPCVDIEQSFGMTLTDYNALTPQVVGFNASTQNNGGDGQPSTLIAYYTASETVTFGFAAEYNYGGYTSMSRTAFSGTQAYHTHSTAPRCCRVASDRAPPVSPLAARFFFLLLSQLPLFYSDSIITAIGIMA